MSQELAKYNKPLGKVKKNLQPCRCPSWHPFRQLRGSRLSYLWHRTTASRRANHRFVSITGSYRSPVRIRVSL